MFMKYLKTFERLGISDNLEQQVRKYMDKIEEEPTKNKFKFFYQNDKGSYYFDLIIVPNLYPEKGSFNTGEYFGSVQMFINLQDRKDFSTLLHEVKHLDYFTRNKKKSNLYVKVGKTLDRTPEKDLVSRSDLEKMGFIFYVYDDNEFQSKYHSYYNDFMEFMDDMVETIKQKKSSYKLTTDAIRTLWKGFLQEHEDATWSYYTTNRVFKFNNYFTKRELNKIFLYMISDYGDSRKIYANPYRDYYSFFMWSIKKDIRTTFNIYSKEQQLKIDTLIKHFETDINKRILKYRKRMTRIVTIACDKYVK